MKLAHWERGGFVIYDKRLEFSRLSYKIFQGKGECFGVLRWDELLSFN